MSPTEGTGASELTRTGLGADALRRAVLENLACLRARYPEIASPHDWYMALAYSVRDRLLARWVSRAKAPGRSGRTSTPLPTSSLLLARSHQRSELLGCL
jgi:hypothetical protein